MCVSRELEVIAELRVCDNDTLGDDDSDDVN